MQEKVYEIGSVVRRSHTPYQVMWRFKEGDTHVYVLCNLVFGDAICVSGEDIDGLEDIDALKISQRLKASRAYFNLYMSLRSEQDLPLDVDLLNDEANEIITQTINDAKEKHRVEQEYRELVECILEQGFFPDGVGGTHNQYLQIVRDLGSDAKAFKAIKEQQHQPPTFIVNADDNQPSSKTYQYQEGRADAFKECFMLSNGFDPKDI